MLWELLSSIRSVSRLDTLCVMPVARGVPGMGLVTPVGVLVGGVT